MTRINTDRRTDSNDFFTVGGVLNGESLSHTPILVFATRDDAVEVSILDQGFAQQTPIPQKASDAKRVICRRNVLGGIVHDYYQAAA